jgi:hypothetical protein
MSQSIPFIGDLTSVPNKNSGSAVVTQKRQDVIYGFVQKYNAQNRTPHQFNSFEEYIRYKIAVSQRQDPRAPT